LTFLQHKGGYHKVSYEKYYRRKIGFINSSIQPRRCICFSTRPGIQFFFIQYEEHLLVSRNDTTISFGDFKMSWSPSIGCYINLYLTASSAQCLLFCMLLPAPFDCVDKKTIAFIQCTFSRLRTILCWMLQHFILFSTITRS
jgi:hypothetical protein